VFSIRGPDVEQQLDVARGCYGLRLIGLHGAQAFLCDVAADAPVLRIERGTADPSLAGAPAQDDSVFSPSQAKYVLSDRISRVDQQRSTGTAHVRLGRSYEDEELLHPLLSGCFAVANWWAGRDGFHGGSFVMDGRAWVVLGAKSMGKSSTLGYLATQGVQILADDLAVVVDKHVVAGPAFVDLRPDAAEQLGIGRDMGMLGARERFRLNVAAPPSKVPLGGWLVLDWSAESTLEPVPVNERLKLLFASRAVMLQPAAPAAFVDYAALPMMKLHRPRSWDSLQGVYQLLSSGLAGLGR
jgi:hypothetical protein